MRRADRSPAAGRSPSAGAGFLLFASLALHPSPALATWEHYGGDPGGRRYSPLALIDRSNVTQLVEVWVHRTGELGEGARSGEKLTFETTPILFAGSLLLDTAFGRVIALDPQTGELRWQYDAGVDRRRSYSEVTSRGVAAWRDRRAPAGAACRERVFAATIDAGLLALDAVTGEPCRDFGTGGEIDLAAAVGMAGNGDYQTTSPPIVLGDLVVVGSSIGDNWSVDTASGVVRAFDARTGAERWRFDPLGEAGEQVRAGAANAWAPLSADLERDLVLVPTGSPSPDFYGGLRPGDGRWGNSVVALRGADGTVAWGFQTVHHDLWDYDLAAQPTLTTVEVEGRRRDVVVQATKMGFLYVLDRDRGEPIFPIVERRVPRSTVGGERAATTQPFPTVPAPLRDASERIDEESVWAIDEEDREACRRLVRGRRHDGWFTPPSLEGTIMFPGNGGGTRWGGVAIDPERDLVVLNAMWTATVVELVPRAQVAAVARASRDTDWQLTAQAGAPYAMRRIDLLSPRGIPCTPPPWGTLTAIDLASGERRWQVVLGRPDAESLLAAHPEADRLGLPNLGGPIVTAGGLVFIAATRERLLRAFDVDSGRELWAGRLPFAGIATPMTYEWSGRQYVVIAAGGYRGMERGDAVVAFALPAPD